MCILPLSATHNTIVKHHVAPSDENTVLKKCLELCRRCHHFLLSLLYTRFVCATKTPQSYIEYFVEYKVKFTVK